MPGQEQCLAGPLNMAAHVCPTPNSRNKWKDVQLRKWTHLSKLQMSHGSTVCQRASINLKEKKKWNEKWCPWLYWCKVKKTSIEGGTQRPCKSKKLTSSAHWPCEVSIHQGLLVSSKVIGLILQQRIVARNSGAWLTATLPVLNRLLHQSRQSEKAS